MNLARSLIPLKPACGLSLLKRKAGAEAISSDQEVRHATGFSSIRPTTPGWMILGVFSG